MKKNLLFACMLGSLIGNVYAQLPVGTTPQNKTVYLEEFTGIRCGYCPDGHRIGTQIHDADPTRVVLVNIHAGGFATVNGASHGGQPDFTTIPGTAIDGMSGMGITGYPAGAVNRKVLTGSVMAAGRSSWTSMANTIKNQAAYCNVACQGTVDPQTRILTVAVEVYYTANSPVSTNSLNVFLLESKIAGYQSNYGNPLYNLANYNEDGTYNHNHVLRASLTGNFGVTIPNTTSTTLFTGTYTYAIPATYGVTNSTGPHTTIPNFENLEVVAFVAQSDRDVINVADGPVSMTKDAKAKSLDLAGFVCGNNIAPVVTIENTGLTPLTTLTITPSIDNVAKAATVWNGNLAAGATTTVALNSIAASTGGGHTLTYSITGDFYTGNNSGKGNYYAAANYQGTPVAEGFSVTTFPPASWAVINADKGATWTRKSGTNLGGFNLSSQCAKYDFFKNSVIGDQDEMYLPPINLEGVEVPEISFDVAYAQRSFSSNDQIEIKASSDCGATWTTVYASGGSALTNVVPIQYEYIPSSADPSEWRTEAAALTGFNKDNVIVKFVTTSDNGNNMYIDNINLSQKNPTGLSKVSAAKLNVAMFPNPSNSVTNIKINSAKAGDASVKVINTLGQVVSEKHSTLTEGFNAIELNVSDLATGIYNVSIETAGGSVVKKLTVIK
jgi:hypothetical protein